MDNGRKFRLLQASIDSLWGGKGLNCDGQQFHHYQLNEQLHLTFTH
jgi:hypothetical protein